MKKIKYLFLFGIIGTFIGSCFSANPFWYNTIIRESNQTALQGLESYNYYNTMNTFDYENGNQYYYNPGFCSYSNYLNFTFDCNGLLNSGNYLNSNLDNFVVFRNRNMLYNSLTSKFIDHQSSFDFDSSGNIKYSIYDCMSGSSTECIQNAYLFFSNSGEFGSLVSSEPASYIHIIGSNYNKNPGILGENKMNHYYFITSKRISSDYGSFYDIPNSYIRKKFYNGLNHTISSISYNSGGFLLFTSTNPLQWSYNESDNIYRLISTSYSGYLVLGVNTYLNGISQNGTIVLSISGGNIFYNYYNSDSPYLNVLSNLTPQDKGYFLDSSLFISFINDSGTYFEVSGTPNNGNLLIRSYLNGLDAGGFYTDYNFELVSDSNTPVIIPPIGDGGNGNQSTGSIAINTGLLNLCLTDLQFGELNPYLCNQLLSNLGNPVQIPGTSGQYISVSIDENGNLRYRITTQEDLAEQMSGFVWVQNEDGSWSTICPSGDCLGTVLAQPIIHGDTGFELTTGDIFDMMTNLTGWVGRCPFPYTDFRLGKNLKLLQLLQDYGFNYDPFIIINCSVAGFQYGRHTIDNTLFGDTFEHPLLYGDTPKHRSLFVFLDFIVILGLFGLFAFIKKIF